MKQTPMPRRKRPLTRGNASLRQGAPLQRHTELGRGTKELRRVAPLARRTELGSKPKPTATPAAATPSKTRPTPKKRPEGYVPEGRGRKAVLTRSENWCEVRRPGVCISGWGHSTHHRLDLSLENRGWPPSRLLRTCGDGSRGCHGWITENPKQAHDEGRWALESHEKPEKTPVLIASPLWPGERRWVLLDDEGGVTPTTAPEEVAA